MVRAWNHFDLWMVSGGHHVGGIRAFSKDKLHHGGGKTYPYVSCKGADTVVLLKWLLFFVRLHLAAIPGDHEHHRLLSWMEQGIQGGLFFTQGIFGHGLWLSRPCMRHLKTAIIDFGVAYNHLSHYCLARQQALYGQVPKMHALMHVKLDFHRALSSGRRFMLNPCAADCSMNEDYVGSVSRLSRRVAFKHNVEATLLGRYLMRTKSCIRKFVKTRRL